MKALKTTLIFKCLLCSSHLIAPNINESLDCSSHRIGKLPWKIDSHFSSGMKERILKLAVLVLKYKGIR